MPAMLERFYRNPAVMVPWCERVGLDPDRILAQPFAIRHEGDEHFAVFVQVDGENPFDDDSPRSERHLTVDVLPFPCIYHPDVEAIGDENGLAREVVGGE